MSVTYFKTRKEARQFCVDNNIRKRSIQFIGLAATLKAGYPWIVSANASAPTTASDLDSMLDGGDNLAPEKVEAVIDYNTPLIVERDPGKFVSGRRYRLVDVEAFKKANGSNRDIINLVNQKNSGVYTGVYTGELERNDLFLHDSEGNRVPFNNTYLNNFIFLHGDERKYFRELPDLPIIQEQITPAVVVESEKDILLRELQVAMSRHEDAIAAATNAFVNVVEITKKIHELNK